MATSAISAEKTSIRSRCWVEASILAFVAPATIWAISKLIARTVPAALHGSDQQRFWWNIASVAIEEWCFVGALWLLLRRRGSSFRDLGVWRVGRWAAWAIALGVGALSVANDLRFLPRMNVPILNAFFPPFGFHLASALFVGITAGFCEEVLYRAFLMSEFAAAGYNKWVQVLVPGIAFGFSHGAYLNLG